MMDIECLKFDENGLIPAIVVDYFTNETLTLAYMNRESLEISIKENRTCFYSRSRKTLWRKGETSGNVQHIVSITADCDFDALKVVVVKDGPACHTGNESCFFNNIYKNSDLKCNNSSEEFSVENLYNLLQQRKEQKPQGSYTTYLFEQGLDKILKKVGEECTEVIVAGKGGEKAETIYEIADLAYHVLVLMVQMEISPEEIKEELKSRHIIDHKVKQQKMR